MTLLDLTTVTHCHTCHATFPRDRWVCPYVADHSAVLDQRQQ